MSDFDLPEIELVSKTEIGIKEMNQLLGWNDPEEVLPEDHVLVLGVVTATEHYRGKEYKFLTEEYAIVYYSREHDMWFYKNGNSVFIKKMHLWANLPEFVKKVGGKDNDPD